MTYMKSNIDFSMNPLLDQSAILKIVKSLYLNKKSSDFDEIRYTTTNLELDDSHMTNENL